MWVVSLLLAIENNVAIKAGGEDHLFQNTNQFCHSPLPSSSPKLYAKNKIQTSFLCPLFPVGSPPVLSSPSSPGSSCKSSF